MPPRIPDRPPPTYRNDPWPARDGYADTTPGYERERDPGFYGGGGGSNGQIAQLQAAATGRRADTKGPVEFNHAINYVNKIKVCIYSVLADNRLVLPISPTSTRIFWRSCRRINVNSVQSKKCIPR